MLKAGTSIKYYDSVVQGSDEWLELRRGVITASEMKLILTPTLKTASNDKEKAHLYELAAQRISGYVEPTYIGDDMLRGYEDEIEARDLYSQHYSPVKEVGFIVNSELGFNIGYSPDGTVLDDGLVEIKSRRQKFQIRTIVECLVENKIPEEYILQAQTGLWVTKRDWLDFISYSGGVEMTTIRVYPDEKIQAAIVSAATEFEEKIQAVIEKYHTAKELFSKFLIPTVRRITEDISC